eukprot:TRINITY_DN66012_c0_g1_i1.p1 TRINITY_DN66012_c0_g1~~TRINITY_DN66012_c0_g1_i1.p1  ORF type:complete len:423 (-),score=59.87 TRINITY_DN66012_c0_g1_i1:314-1582(-)
MGEMASELDKVTRNSSLLLSPNLTSQENFDSLVTNATTEFVKALPTDSLLQDGLQPVNGHKFDDEINYLYYVPEFILQNSAIFSVLALMSLGVLLRRSSLVSDRLADILRRICFKVLLPPLLLRNIWLAKVDDSLYAIAALSVCFHIARFFVSVLIARKLEPFHRMRQGWLIMMTQGEMLAFLFPLLLSTAQLSGRALACCIMWDLFGNMWVCQGALWGVAEHYGEFKEAAGRHPSPHKGSGDIELAEFDPDLRKSVQATLPSGGSRGTAVRAAWAVVTQPLLHYCLIAFALNLGGVPLPKELDGPLWISGSLFKPLMYTVVGFMGASHALDYSDLQAALQALSMRYVLAALGSIGITIAIDDRVFRSTLILALLSPSTSNVIQIVAETGYGEQQLKRTICTGFISTLVSTFLQHTFVKFLI